MCSTVLSLSACKQNNLPARRLPPVPDHVKDDESLPVRRTFRDLVTVYHVVMINADGDSLQGDTNMLVVLDKAARRLGA